MAIAFSNGGAAQRSTLYSHVSQVVDSDLIDLGSGAHGRLVEVGDSTWLLLQDRVVEANDGIPFFARWMELAEGVPFTYCVPLV